MSQSSPARFQDPEATASSRKAYAALLEAVDEGSAITTQKKGMDSLLASFRRQNALLAELTPLLTGVSTAIFSCNFLTCRSFVSRR